MILNNNDKSIPVIRSNNNKWIPVHFSISKTWTGLQQNHSCCQYRCKRSCQLASPIVVTDANCKVFRKLSVEGSCIQMIMCFSHWGYPGKHHCMCMLEGKAASQFRRLIYFLIQPGTSLCLKNHVVSLAMLHQALIAQWLTLSGNVVGQPWKCLLQESFILDSYRPDVSYATKLQSRTRSRLLGSLQIAL